MCFIKKTSFVIFMNFSDKWSYLYTGSYLRYKYTWIVTTAKLFIKNVSQQILQFMSTFDFILLICIEYWDEAHTARGTYCTMLMLNAIHVTRITYCTKTKLHEAHTARRTYCTVLMLYAVHATPIPYCTKTKLHEAHTARDTYCTMLMLHVVLATPIPYCTKTKMHEAHTARDRYCMKSILQRAIITFS